MMNSSTARVNELTNSVAEKEKRIQSLLETLEKAKSGYLTMKTEKQDLQQQLKDLQESINEKNRVLEKANKEMNELREIREKMRDELQLMKVSQYHTVY